MIVAQEGKVYRGLIHLLAYALRPKNRHSYRWVKPILTFLFNRQAVPVHRCPACGKLAPNCRCWQRNASDA
jgi:hypothetical protein